MLEQLKHFPMASHDDAPDHALEMARTIAKKGKRFRILDKKIWDIGGKRMSVIYMDRSSFNSLDENDIKRIYNENKMSLERYK